MNDNNTAWTAGQVDAWKVFDEMVRHLLDHVDAAHPSYDGDWIIAGQWEEFRNLFPEASAQDLQWAARFAANQVSRQADWLERFAADIRLPSGKEEGR